MIPNFDNFTLQKWEKNLSIAKIHITNILYVIQLFFVWCWISSLYLRAESRDLSLLSYFFFHFIMFEYPPASRNPQPPPCKAIPGTGIWKLRAKK